MQFGKCREYPFLIPVVTLHLESYTVQSRVIRANWTPEMAADIAAFQPMDAEAELTAILTDELRGAGLIWAPYISMQAEPVIVGEFEPRRAIASRYASRRMVDATYFNTVGVDALLSSNLSLRFPRLKMLRFWGKEEEFESVQFPIVRRVFAPLLPNEPVIDTTAENNGAVYRQLAEWARLIEDTRTN
jgi:hypothetical protein